jgi:hypothetical protein
MKIFISHSLIINSSLEIENKICCEFFASPEMRNARGAEKERRKEIKKNFFKGKRLLDFFSP